MNSPMLDPYQTSKIPGAKPPKPDKPPKPRNLQMISQQKSSDSPEWLTFSEKKRRFEQQSKSSTTESRNEQSDTYSESKRFSYLSADELERLKEEEAKKLASFSEDQIKSMMNEEDEDGDGDDEEGFDQFMSEETTEVITSDNQRIFRTAKAERRYKEKMRKAGLDFEFEEQLQNLTPNQRRQLEAEKRALWRQARLKSLEDDAMRAQMVMQKVKQMSEQMEARPVSPQIQALDIEIDIDNSNG